MTTDEYYIQRCFDLARLGAGKVSPNPMVGAVLVHEGKIIGEGWHARYGTAHAEVNAVANVKERDLALLSKSCLYVSLEPCCIHGNTPPCTDLILKHHIPKVVISCLDFTPEVHGKGVEILRKAGVEVLSHILRKQGEQLSASRKVFVTQHRPFIILKYAQTQEGFLAGEDREQVWISNQYSKRLVHKWRSEVDAILIGTTTAASDNPALTNRLYFGGSPLRVVLDRRLKLSPDLAIFDDSSPTLAYNELLSKASGKHNWKQIDFSNLLPTILQDLYSRKVSNLIVEGGAHLLHQFVEANLWDEARVFIGDTNLPKGICAPILPVRNVESYPIGNDLLKIFRNS